MAHLTVHLDDRSSDEQRDAVRGALAERLQVLADDGYLDSGSVAGDELDKGGYVIYTSFSAAFKDVAHVLDTLQREVADAEQVTAIDRSWD